MQRLNAQQIEVIQQELAAGMSPADIANKFGRLNDLELDEIALIRSAAAELKRGADPEHLLE
ncbi:hypothetical protein [Nocardia tengchongensis]|uniref:hypothetical protein n=1 Tax=Nocardia tengchongensis TaxID=2055889 RepID=UPI003658E52F